MLKIEEIKDDIIKELEECLAKEEEDAEVGCVLASHVNYPVECYRSCNECYLKVFKMLLEEVNEPIKLSKLEYEILKYAKKECGFNYIAKDENGELDLFKRKPIKNGFYWTNAYYCDNPDKSYDSDAEELCLFDSAEGKIFKFIQWEDEEPIDIQNILGNCVIIDDGQCRIIEG